MKLLDYTGLQRLVEKLKLSFYKKSDFDSAVNKLHWIGNYGSESSFELSSYLREMQK